MAKKTEQFVVASKVKGLIKSKKCMTSSEFVPALNKAVAALVTRATERARANKRTTLRERDL